MTQGPSGEEEEIIQPKPIESSITPLIQRQPTEEDEEEELVQTNEIPGHSPTVAPGIQAQIDALGGSGQPLPESTRDFFEPRFGYDFSQVRVHTDSKAAESTQSLKARAYTIGHNIVFGTDEYSPNKVEGKRLLAHELTHVIQQGGLRGNSSEQRNTPDGKPVSKSLNNRINPLQNSSIIQRIIGTDEEIGPPSTSDFPIRPGEPLPYREATELLECIRIMGEENAAYCRAQVLGENSPAQVPTPATPPAAGPAPAPAPCTPRPVATLNEFRAPAGGSTSGENCCPICPVSLGIGAGGEARQGMEMRIEITNPCPAAYEITRVRETWLWERVGGVWRELEHQGPGERDDHHDDDECHTLQRGRFLYVVDRPGWGRALPAPAAWRPAGVTGVSTDSAATEVVAQDNFAEWVIFRHRGHGIPWTVISSPRFFYWHDVIWLEKVGGSWRLQAGSNEIARGLRRPAVSP